MDAFLSTLLAVFVAEIGDRPQLLCAALAIRFGNTRAVLLGAAAATALNCAIAAFAGAAVASWISEEPVRLFYALSLLFAGIGMLAWRRPIDPLDNWKTGAFATAFLGLFVLQFGDKGQFIVAATAARTQAPEWAMLGGWVGSMAAIALAVVLREKLAELIPVRTLRVIGGVVFLLLGLALAMSAWGLFG